MQADLQVAMDDLRTRYWVGSKDGQIDAAKADHGVNAVSRRLRA